MVGLSAVTNWRAAFLTQVGLSALNLVDKVSLCHYDIRLPNIAVRNGRFCLVDFDFVHPSVLFQQRSAFSPPLKTGATRWRTFEMEMCYSVSQIAVNVFILCAPTQFNFDDVKSATYGVRSGPWRRQSTENFRRGLMAKESYCRASSRPSGPSATQSAVHWFIGSRRTSSGTL